MCALNSLAASARMFLSLTLLTVSVCMASGNGHFPEKGNAHKFFETYSTLSITAPPDTALVMKTPGRCDTLIDLPPAVFSLMPGCTVRDVVMKTPVGDIHSNGGVVRLGTGIFKIVYCAYDDCGHSGCDSMILVILDSQAPNMTCRSEAVVNLDSDGQGFVPASYLDGGSYDDCGHVFFKARRMSLPAGYSCQPADNPFNKFDDEVHFCCLDISNSPISVIVRAYDVHPGDGVVQDSFYLNHYVECTVRITVKDKLEPSLDIPADVTVSCGADLDSLYRAMQPRYGDNCARPALDERLIRHLNGCGSGYIERIFTVTDGAGVFVTKTQRITVRTSSTFNGLDPDQLRWPDHKTVYACRVNTDTIDAGRPVIKEYECDQVTVNKKDDAYTFDRGGVCAKVLRHWTVINWCVYNPYLTPNPRIPENGYYAYDQEIKIMDTIPPRFGAIRDTTLYSLAPDCGLSNIQMNAVIASDCGVSTGIRLSYQVDYYCDGQTDRSGLGGNAGGVWPMGRHKIIYTAEDSCHNFSTALQYVTVKDGKAPSISILYGLSTTLQEMAGGVMARVNAARLNNKSEDNCTASEKLIFSFSKDPADSIRIFDCDSIAVHAFDIYVFDECGNHSHARTFITIDDLNGLCPGNLKTSSVFGTIATPRGTALENVEVVLRDSVHFEKTSTGPQGRYAFQDMPVGTRFILDANCNDDALKGVTTADIVRIQQHILGKSVITDPMDLLAADVDMNERINGNDISWIRKLILGLASEFPVRKSFLFMSSKIAFRDSLSPWQDYYRSSAPGGQINAGGCVMDFSGIKLGDVNSGPAKRENKSIDLICSIEQNKLVFRIKQRTSTYGFHLMIRSEWLGDLKWSDESPVIRDGFAYEYHQKSPDEFHLVATCGALTELHENEMLISIPISPDALRASQSKIADASGINELIGADLESVKINISQVSSSGPLEVVSWGPNPAHDDYHVIMRTGGSADIRYEITDQEGRLRSSGAVHAVGEYHDLQLPREKFGLPGLFLIRIVSSNYNWSDKVIIQ